MCVCVCVCVCVTCEGDNGVRVPEVDESISEIALVSKVNREIEKVVGSCMVPVNELEQRCLGVLVGHIPEHHRRPSVYPLQHSA